MSGLLGLDALLGGGLDRGSSVLLLGPAGSGKSSLAMQYAVAAAQRGESSAIFLFDEHPNVYFARAASLGIALQAQVEAGRIAIQKLDPAEMPPGEFIHLIRQGVERHQARIVVIDSVSSYLHAMSQKRLLNLHFHKLLTYLNNQGIVTLLIMVQHVIGTDVTSAADLSYLVDTIILLRFFEAKSEIRLAIAVVKKRTGGHERTIRELRLGPAGIQVGEPLLGFQGILTGAPCYRAKGSLLLGDKP